MLKSSMWLVWWDDRAAVDIHTIREAGRTYKEDIHTGILAVYRQGVLQIASHDINTNPHRFLAWRNPWGGLDFQQSCSTFHAVYAWKQVQIIYKSCSDEKYSLILKGFCLMLSKVPRDWDDGAAPLTNAGGCRKATEFIMEWLFIMYLQLWVTSQI